LLLIALPRLLQPLLVLTGSRAIHLGDTVCHGVPDLIMGYFPNL
jgi:hypothetical protein